LARAPRFPLHINNLPQSPTFHHFNFYILLAAPFSCFLQEKINLKLACRKALFQHGESRQPAFSLCNYFFKKAS
jgi:hypothetical protein